MKLAMLFFRLILVSLFIGICGSAQAQTTTCHGRQIRILDFRSPVLISGTALSVGAVYRFSNVATGVDARVTVNAITGGTLGIIDRDTGLIANFQPELDGSNARSIDFTISFFVAGTSTPMSLDIAASGIDIDGDSGSLREYAEFSSPFASYVLETPTNLDVNASGPSTAGNFRFESRTTFTAPGIDPTATQNIVSILYTGVSSFRYRIGALGTGSTTRLTSLDFSCPVLSFPNSNPQVPQDFGDAPASYGNPVHDIVTGFRLGATNSAETAPYNSPTASGDAGDDGVTLSSMIQGQSGTATVIVSGSGGRLQVWFDWNKDGDFNDAGEQVAINIQDNGAGDTNPATGTIGLNFTVPVSAVTGQSFARFRWATQVDLGFTLIASNGEVEDYAVSVSPSPAVLNVSKTSDVYATPAGYNFSVPGNDMVYTITVTNTGNSPVDTNKVFVLDSLPTELEFFNGDMDGTGPATGAVYFTQTGAGLTFTLATDLAYSNLVAKPATFANCTYTPALGYDPNVKHICVNPKGSMLAGSPSPSFKLFFRARIK